jgi:hypothetical protein
VLDIDSSKEHLPQVALAPGWSCAEEYLRLAEAAALKIEIGSFQEGGLIVADSHQYCDSKSSEKTPTRGGRIRIIIIGARPLRRSLR